MSIMEIMVAAGLVSVVSLGISTMMHNSTKAQRNISLSNDFEHRLETVAQVLNKDNACMDFLTTDAGANGGGFEPAAVAGGAPYAGVDRISWDPDGAGPAPRQVIMQETPGAVSGLWIRDIRFVRAANIGPRPGGGTMWLATLQIQVQKTGSSGAAGAGTTGALVGSPISVRELNMTVAEDAAGTITTCYGQFGSSDFCNAIGGMWLAGSCDVTNITCTDLGGVWNAGAGSCTLGAGAGPIPLDAHIRDVSCGNIGGVMGAGAPPCTIPAPTNPTQPITCAALGGTMVGTVCDTVSPSCTRAGGIPVNPGTVNAYCDMVTNACNAIPGAVVAGVAPNLWCDTRAPMCASMGGTYNAGTGVCTPRALGTVACHDVTLGDTGQTFWTGVRSAGNGCSAEEYVARIRFGQDRDPQAFSPDRYNNWIILTCCKPW